jgi:uncharacterized delta-60 repeat protein
VDTSFGDAGSTFTAFPDGGVAFTASAFDDGAHLAIQGGMLDVGNSSSHPARLTRYTASGAVDPTFNGGAPVVLDFGTGASEKLTGVLVQSDKKLVAFGYSFSGGVDDRSLLARVNPDGSLDGTFGTGGKVVNLTPGQVPGVEGSRLFSAMQQPDGKLLVAGQLGDGEWFIERFTSAGAVDTSLGDAGASTQPSIKGNPFGVVTQSDGKIVTFGAFTGSGRQWGLVRFALGGGLDGTYGVGGTITIPAGDGTSGGSEGITSGILDNSDRLLVVGSDVTDAGAAFAATRVNADGTLDHHFNSGAPTVVSIGANDAFVSRVVATPDGKFLVLGTSPNGGISVVRLLSDGTPDTTCGSSGLVTVPVGVGNYNALRATVDSAGRLVIAGQGTNASAGGMWLTRLWL